VEGLGSCGVDDPTDEIHPGQNIFVPVVVSDGYSPDMQVVLEWKDWRRKPCMAHRFLYPTEP
jgi:hypothetical protein